MKDGCLDPSKLRGGNVDVLLLGHCQSVQKLLYIHSQRGLAKLMSRERMGNWGRRISLLKLWLGEDVSVQKDLQGKTAHTSAINKRG